jgi:hypothetical protein
MDRRDFLLGTLGATVVLSQSGCIANFWRPTVNVQRVPAAHVQSDRNLCNDIRRTFMGGRRTSITITLAVKE